MIQILFDIYMPKSCAECPFMVNCDECDSWENYCPILCKRIGYDNNEPYTPKDHRREDCPLKEVQTVERPHGEWKVDNKIYCSECGKSICDFIPNPNDAVALILDNKFCFNCGSDNTKSGDGE